MLEQLRDSYRRLAAWLNRNLITFGFTRHNSTLKYSSSITRRNRPTFSGNIKSWQVNICHLWCILAFIHKALLPHPQPGPPLSDNCP